MNKMRVDMTIDQMTMYLNNIQNNSTNAEYNRDQVRFLLEELKNELAKEGQK